MKLTLMIEGSPSVIAAVIASLPPGAETSVEQTTFSGQAGTPQPVTPPAPTLPPATLAPATVVPGVAVTPPPMPTNPAADEEDDTPNPAPPPVDSTGIPWDERIHSDNKGVSKAGAWRRRRNVSDELFAFVEAELRAAAAAGAPATPVVQTAPPVTPAAPVVVAPPPMPDPAAVVAPGVQTAPPVAPSPSPVVPPAPVVATGPAPAPSLDGLDFARFMQHVSVRMGEGAFAANQLASWSSEINTAWVNIGQPGINSITDVGTDPQKLTYAVQLMQRDGKW